jgi:glycine cleavage system regulatory protein
MDHPGIVHKLTRVLSEHGVNVVRLDTSLSNAPVTGTPVFSLDLEAEVPAGVPVKALRGRLERLAEAENIDLELRAAK